jgi:hypothetical protein
MRWAFMCVCLLLVVGCQGTATTSLSAGDALDRAADQIGVTVDEYHDAVSLADDAKEDEVAAAFAARVVSDPDNAEAHAKAFTLAMRKIRVDREVEWTRRNASKENVAAIREVAKGLRRLALDSLSLNDEARRYFTGWYETYERSKAERESQRAAQKQAKIENQNNLIRMGVGAAAPQYSPIVDEVLKHRGGGQ